MAPPAKMVHPQLDGSTADGYWLPHTANHDFCEPNYAHSYYITEFFNAISGYVVAHAGFILWFQASILFRLSLMMSKYCKTAFDCDRAHGTSKSYERLLAPFPYMAFLRLRALAAAFIFVGIGTVWFHGTMSRAGQVCDELPMVVFAILFRYVLSLECGEGLGYAGAVYEWGKEVVGRDKEENKKKENDKNENNNQINVINNNSLSNRLDLAKCAPLADIAKIYEKLDLIEGVISMAIGATIYFSFSFWVFILTYAICIARLMLNCGLACFAADKQMEFDDEQSGFRARLHRRSLTSSGPLFFVARWMYKGVIQEKLRGVEEEYGSDGDSGESEKPVSKGGNAKSNTVKGSDAAAKESDGAPAFDKFSTSVDDFLPFYFTGRTLTILLFVCYVGGTIIFWLPVEVFCQQFGKPVLASVDFIWLAWKFIHGVQVCLVGILSALSGMPWQDIWIMFANGFGDVSTAVTTFANTCLWFLRDVNIMVFCHPIFHVTSSMGCVALGQIMIWTGIRVRGFRPTLRPGSWWTLGIPKVTLEVERNIRSSASAGAEREKNAVGTTLLEAESMRSEGGGSARRKKEI